MSDWGGFLNALGQAFGGYALDRKNAEDEDEKQQKIKDAAAKAQQAEEDRRAGLALKGVRQGVAPDMGAINNATALAQSFTGGVAPSVLQAKTQAARADDPDFYDPNRFQQISPNQYLDRYATPESVASRKQETQIAAADARAASAQRARDVLQQAHERFLQEQQQRAQQAADERAARQKDHYTFITTTGPNGEQIVSRANTSTGAIEPTGTAAKQGGTNSATGRLQNARMLSAVSEARLADERMRAFEDDLLSGKQKIGTVAQAGGNLMTNLAGSHSLLGALGQSGSEAGLNATNPAYAQYLRDAMTIGRAEQMISPRGGNETMVRANSLLARAGTGANKATIDASRMARQALFGKAGGIQQTLSPQESEKLEAGVAKIKGGDTGSPEPDTPLATRVQQLKALGLSKEAARQQLIHEGLLPAHP